MSAAVLPVMQSPPSLADPVTSISVASAPIPTGTNPSQFIHNHLPWVDTTTLTHITSGILDPAHLIKLIPTDDRPPVKNATSSTSGILLDIELSKVSLVADENPAFEKHFPTFQHFLTAITVYGAIRDIYDRDNVRFGTAVLMYTRQLATWLRQGLSWRAVLSYAIAHFRKYQSSTDPNVWIHIDPQLMSTTIVTRQAVFHSPTTATAQGRNKPICRNYNDAAKGCTFPFCRRLHACSKCNAEGHPAYQCKAPSSKPTQSNP